MKKILIFISLLQFLFSGCIETFTPDFDEAPVLYMNSLITAGEPIEIFVGRTYRFDDPDAIQTSDCIQNATVVLYVDGMERETLVYDGNRETPLYYGSHIPQCGEKLMIKASHDVYGSAEAEVVIPDMVSIDNVSKSLSFSMIYVYDGIIYGGEPYDKDESLKERPQMMISGFPNLKLQIGFTDSKGFGDCYTLDGYITGVEGDMDSGFIDWSHYSMDYSDDLIFSEHLSALEKVFDIDSWGCAFFSDKQIDGHPYGVKIGFQYGNFSLYNPNGDDKYYNLDAHLRLAHISSPYYNFLLSRWKSVDGFEGQLSSVGLAPEIRTFSNVSTGAGIVAARTLTEVTLPLSEDLKECLRQAGLLEE